MELDMPTLRRSVANLIATRLEKPYLLLLILEEVSPDTQEIEKFLNVYLTHYPEDKNYLTVHREYLIVAREEESDIRKASKIFEEIKASLNRHK